MNLQDALDRWDDKRGMLTQEYGTIVEAARRVANLEQPLARLVDAVNDMYDEDDDDFVAETEEWDALLDAAIDVRAAFGITEDDELAKGAAAYADEDLTIAEQTSRLSLEDITEDE